MKIVNKQAEAIPSKISVREFGKAMKQLDLSTIPPEKKAYAIRDHLMGIMSDNISSPTAAFDLSMAQQMYRKTKNGS